MRFFHPRLFLLLLLFLCSASYTQAQVEEGDLPYPKKLTVKLGMGPSFLSVDYGFHLQNQFDIELGKHFTLSASYGTAQAYSGLDNVQRWYFPPDIDIKDDDHFRHQSLIFANLGFQISPLNTEHHRLYVSLGPGLNIHNFSKAEIRPQADSIAFVMTNSKTSQFSYNISAGYDLILGDHIVIGLTLYYASLRDYMYSILLSGGYRF